jgi:hypothetical protein
LSVTPTYARTTVIVHPRHSGSSDAGHIGDVSPHEELPPTRFPTMLVGVHWRPPPSVTCPNTTGWPPVNGSGQR